MNRRPDRRLLIIFAVLLSFATGLPFLRADSAPPAPSSTAYSDIITAGFDQPPPAASASTDYGSVVSVGFDQPPPAASASTDYGSVVSVGFDQPPPAAPSSTAYGNVVTVFPDATPPTISSSTPANGSTVAGATCITVNLVDDSGYVDYQGSIAGATVTWGTLTIPGSWAVVNNSIVFTPAPNVPMKNGIYTVSLYPKDIVGNQPTNPETIIFTIDSTKNMVGYWPMDGNWNDASGHGNNGTAFGNVTFANLSSTAQRGAMAGSFNGTDQYVKVGSSALIANATQSTIEAWIYPTALDPGKVIYSENNYWGAVFYLYLGLGKANLGIERGSSWYGVSSSGNLIVSTWSHIAATIGPNGTKIYVNGILSSSNPNILPSSSSVSEVDLGRVSNSGGIDYFPGLLDEVVVYNRALTADEIKAHYQYGLLINNTLNAPTVNQITSPTASAFANFSGTKDSGTAILINNVQAVPLDMQATWRVNNYQLPDGLNTLSFQEKDQTGNVSIATTVKVQVDTAAPVNNSVLINNGALYTNNASVTLNLSSTDTNTGVSMMQFSNDGTNWSNWQPYAATATWTLTSGDGIKTVYARFEDGVGNISAPVSTSITLDTVAPPAPVITAYKTPTGQSSETVSGTKSTDTQTIVVSVNGANLAGSHVTYPTGTTWTAQLTGLIAGNNSIVVTAVDAAGNSSPAVTINIAYDNTAPSWTKGAGVRFVEPGNGQAIIRWNKAVDAAGEGVGYNIYKSGTTPIDFTRATKISVPVGFNESDYAGKGYDYQYTLTGLTNNTPYYVAVRTIDGLGNEDTNTVALKVVPQVTAGATVNYLAANWTGSMTSVVVNADGSLSLSPGATTGTYTSPPIDFGIGNSVSAVGINSIVDTSSNQSVSVAIDNGSGNGWINVSDGQQTSLPSGENIRYHVTLTGNGTSSPALNSVSLANNDFVPPAIPVVNTYPSFTNLTSLPISGTKEAGSSVWINGKQVVPVDNTTTWQAALPIPREGANSFGIYAVDEAGNTGQTGNFIVTRDTTPPTVSATTPSNGAYSQAITEIDVTLSDTGVGPDLNGSITGATVMRGATTIAGTWSASNGKLGFKPANSLVDGVYTVSLYPVDLLGNKSATPYTFSFTIDTTPPTVQLSMSPVSPFKAGQETFTLSFDEDMNTAVNPVVSFGLASPYNSYTVSGGSWIDSKHFSCAYTFVQGAPPDGNYTLNVTSAKDLAGNVMTDATPASFVFDTTPPATPAITGNIVTPTNVANLSLSGTKAAGVAISINGRVYVALDGSTTWSCVYPLVEGTNTLNIVAVDVAGNDSAPVSPAPSVVLKTTPPNFTVNYTSPTSSTTQLLTGTKDPGINLKVNGATIVDSTDSSTTWSYQITLTDGITNNLVFTASDTLGNTKGQTISIVCDTTPPPPLGPGVLEANGSGIGTTVTLNWSGYNESLVPDLAYYKIYVSPAPITDISGMSIIGTATKGTKTFTATGLIKGTTYYFAVVPVNQNGVYDTKVNDASAAPTDTQAPEDVTNLTALCSYDKSTGSNSVIITWTGSVNSCGDLASQKVYFDGGTGYDSGTALTKDALTYTKTGVADNTHIKLKVTEIDNSGNESAGREVEATTRIPNPAGLSASPGVGSINLSWNPVSSPYLKQYNVYQSTGSQQQSDASMMTLVKSTTATSAAISGLTNGDTYQFAVTSVNTSNAENTTIASVSGTPRSDTTGPTINTFTVSVGSTVIPTGSAVTQPAVVNVSATDAESAMGRIELYIDGNLVSTQSGGSLSYNWDTIQTTDGNHTVKVIAYDAPGNPTTVQQTYDVSLAPPPVPVIVSHVLSTGTNPVTASISGTAAQETTVTLFLGGVAVGTAAIQNGQFSFTGVALQEGGNALQAKASDRGGDSPLSTVYTINVNTIPPPAPTGLTATAQAGGNVHFTWNAGTGEVLAGYNLYISSNPFTSIGSGVSKTNSTPIPYPLTDFKPQDDNVYYYAVTAVDSSGNESPISNVVSIASDRVAPYITGIDYSYTDKSGTVTQHAQIAGPGKVDVYLSVSESLSEPPFFSVMPPTGSPIVVSLSNTDNTHWQGEFDVNSLTPDGPTQYQFTGKDMVGNRGTATGKSITLRVHGPVASITAPVSLLQITNNPVTVNVGFDEAPVGLPSLALVDSSGTRSGIQSLTTNDGLNFTGTVNVSGMAECQATFNLISSVDVFGNEGNTVASGKNITLYLTTPPAPPVPGGLAAISGKGGKITLSWNAVGGAVAYKLYRRAAGDSQATVIQSGLTGTSTVDVPATDGKYYYSVSSVGQLSSESAPSAEVEGDCYKTPPGAPVNLSLSFGASGVTASWAAPTGEVPTSYNLYRSGSPITADNIASLTPVVSGIKALTASDPSPDVSLPYYVVTALDVVGNEGQPSASQSITFPVAPVRNLQLIVEEGSAPVLTWDQPQSAAGYNIYRNGMKLNDTPLSQLYYTDSYYNGGTVTYGVSAVDSNNNESPVKEVVYSGFTAGLAPGVTFNRGCLQQVPVLLNNPGNTGITVDSVTLQVGQGAQSVLSGPFAVGANANLQIEKIGATGLTEPSPVAVSVTAQWSPSPGVTVIVSSSQTAQVTGAGPTMDIYSDPLIRGSNANVKLKIYNTGTADMDLVTSENGGPSSQVTVYLKDQDGNVLAQGSLNQRVDSAGMIMNGSNFAVARIAPGNSFTTANITIPVPANAPYAVNLEADVTNTYYHYQAPEQVTAPGIKQVLQTNISDTTYRAIAYVGQTFYANAQPVVITGQAINNTTGAPMPLVPVVIGISVKGFVRNYTVNTDNNGNFTYTFTPGSNEAGIYTVWANHPDVNTESDQATFTIAGLTMSPGTATITVVKGSSYDIPLTLTNPGETSITGIAYSVTAGDGVSASVVNNNSNSLSPGTTVNEALKVTASDSAPDVSQLTLNVSTNEGPKATLNVTVITVSAIPIITVTPNNYIDTGIVTGNQQVITLTLTNTGAATLSNAQIQGPTLSWISLATPTAIGDVAPGGTATIAIILKPDANLPQNVYEDSMTITSDNHIPFKIPIQCTVVTSSTGSAQFDVLNSLNNKVAGANVLIQNSQLTNITYSETTDANGGALFADIPAGSYTFTVSASGCKPYSGSFDVTPGLVGYVPVGLEVNMVEVEFSVTPVLINDTYQIVVTQTFQTNVPVPVLVVDPPAVNLPVMNSGDIYNGELTITNYGLIEVDNVSLSMPTSFDTYTVEYLNNIPSTIGAMQSITIPYRIIKQ